MLEFGLKMHHMGTINEFGVSFINVYFLAGQQVRLLATFRTPYLDRDGGQSALSTSNRWLLLPSLTCIVMYSCSSKCMSSLVLSTCLLLLRLLCRLLGRWILLSLINVWNATAVECMRCATKSARCFCPSPYARICNIICHDISGVDNDDFVAVLVKRVTCLLKCVNPCLGVCHKPILNDSTLIIMLENGFITGKHSCLKVRDDPGKTYLTKIIVSTFVKTYLPNTIL